MISLIAESLRLLACLQENHCSLKLLPIPKCALRRPRFFLQILLHVRCNPREPFCKGSLNPFNFNFVSCALLSRASRRFSLEVPSALKSLPAIGMKHHSLSPT